MKKYKLFSSNSDTVLLLGYEQEKRQLCYMEIVSGLPSVELWHCAPRYLYSIDELRSNAARWGWTIAEFKEEQEQTAPAPVAAVPTFDEFWNAFGYKVDKEDARQAWKKLKPAEQVAAFQYIERYNSHLARTGVARKYPKTYLSKKVWEV